MNIPRRGPLALAAMVGAALVLVTPAAAIANEYWGDEHDFAVSSAAPGGTYYCADVPGGLACFKPYGDKFYVYDRWADGRSAAADWSVFVGDNEKRAGACVNRLTAGHWGVCDKNFSEDLSLMLCAAIYDNGDFIDAGECRSLVT